MPNLLGLVKFYKKEIPFWNRYKTDETISHEDWLKKGPYENIFRSGKYHVYDIDGDNDLVVDINTFSFKELYKNIIKKKF